MSNIKVLYEDNHIIAVFKPTGVLSQPDNSGDMSIYDLAKDYIKEKKNKKTPSNPSGQAGNVFLGLLHRLDRPVSGIILFAKTSKGASRISEQFRNQTVEKTYQCLVLGKPKEKRGVLTHFLEKDEKLRKAKEYKDGKEVNLYYEVIKSNDRYSLLKIKIEGGKFHQIRAQLSLAGFPILGDIKYGGPNWDDPQSIALCATNLEFRAATQEKMITLSVELPENWHKWVG